MYLDMYMHLRKLSYVKLCTCIMVYKYMYIAYSVLYKYHTCNLVCRNILSMNISQTVVVQIPCVVIFPHQITIALSRIVTRGVPESYIYLRRCLAIIATYAESDEEFQVRG